MSFIQQDLYPQARGDTWNFQFLMQDINGVAIDITGNQYWFTLKSDVALEDADKSCSKDCDAEEVNRASWLTALARS